MRGTWRWCGRGWKGRRWCSVRPRPAWKVITTRGRESTACWKCRRGRTTRKCRWCGWWTCGRWRGTRRRAPIFSPALQEAMRQRLERKEQTILFLNRRGYATSLQCELCGYVAECPDCSVSLTYHRQEQKLKCHICGHEHAAPLVCPGGQMPQSGHPLLRAGDGAGRVHPAGAVSAGAHPADGFGHVEAEGGLPAGAGRRADGEDRHPGRHADDRQGAAFSRT